MREGVGFINGGSAADAHDGGRFSSGRLWPFSLIALTAVAVRIPCFFLPMNRDSGLFAYGGWRLLHGDLPYVDFWDNKLPGVFYINALAIRLFGPSLTGIHIFQIIYGVAAAWLFYIVARRFARKGAALAAAILFAFYHGCYGLAEDGNYTETYVVLPVLLAILLVTTWSRERKGYWLPFSAGALGAVAAIIKQPAVAVVGAMVVFCLFGRRRGGVAAAGSVVAGAALVGLAGLVWMQAAGVLKDAIDANVVFNRLYFADAYSYGRRIAEWNAIRGAALMALPLAGAILGVWAIRRRSSERRHCWSLLASWFVLDMLGVALGGRFYNHYFVAALPSAFILTAIAIDYMVMSRRRGLAAALGAVFFFGPVWSMSGAGEFRSFPVVSVAQQEFHALDWIMNKRVGEGRKLPFEQIEEWLSDHTTDDDTIYIWGWETRAAFLAQRKMCSRYLHMHAIAATGFDRDARIAELARAIETNRPKYIVDCHPLMPTTAPPLDAPSPIPSTAPFFRLDGYEPIQRVVVQHYRPVATAAGCRVFERLREDPP